MASPEMRSSDGSCEGFPSSECKTAATAIVPSGRRPNRAAGGISRWIGDDPHGGERHAEFFGERRSVK
jgi:hypothetical protein